MPAQPNSHREGQGGPSTVESPMHSLMESCRQLLKQSKLADQGFQTHLSGG